jgi:hypothetical protein
MASNRECVFCGGDDLDKEHALPGWMSKYFRDLTGYTATGFIGAQENDVVNYVPPGPVPGAVVGNTTRTVGAAGRFALTTRSVCCSCNGGWMSTLEANVEPILGPMFSGLPTLLTDDRAELLSIWALKTALVLTLTWDRGLPPQPFHELYDTRQPSSSTTVWCGYRPDFMLRQDTRPLQSNSADASGFPDGFMATAWLGHVVIVVDSHFLGCAPRNVVVSQQDAVTIWPLEAHPEPRVWPPPITISDAHISAWIQGTEPRIARPR